MDYSQTLRGKLKTVLAELLNDYNEAVEQRRTLKERPDAQSDYWKVSGRVEALKFATGAIDVLNMLPTREAIEITYDGLSYRANEATEDYTDSAENNHEGAMYALGKAAAYTAAAYLLAQSVLDA